jgi:hypothetical protein
MWNNGEMWNCGEMVWNGGENSMSALFLGRIITCDLVEAIDLARGYNFPSNLALSLASRVKNYSS